MVSSAELAPGRPYFTVTYDARTSAPIVTTYVFLGRDPAGVPADPAGARYYFRILPPFQNAAAEDEDKASAAEWSKIFPGGFEGWGESWPTPVREDALADFLTLPGLLAELEAPEGGSRSDLRPVALRWDE